MFIADDDMEGNAQMAQMATEALRTTTLNGSLKVRSARHSREHLKLQKLYAFVRGGQDPESSLFEACALFPQIAQHIEPHLGDPCKYAAWAYMAEAQAEKVGLLARITHELDILQGVDQAQSSLPLRQAARLGHVPLLKVLVEAGFDINGADTDHETKGCTALMWAILRGHDQAAELLVSAGANQHARDKSGDTALTLAALRPRGIPDFLQQHAGPATRVASAPTFQRQRFNSDVLLSTVIAHPEEEAKPAREEVLPTTTQPENESALQQEMNQLAQAGLSFGAPVCKGRKPTKGRARGGRRV
eukprot:TRINITY_DN726_c0_g2_i1.p1 TRINITY_DN726_c0_g2~~TRINITY_DN726_c0_g2_i1.p1  ORF type:complete len:303 (-),score=59.08 TRINITY_DN726_c0_g2_i1:275-1183(-)